MSKGSSLSDGRFEVDVAEAAERLEELVAAAERGSVQFVIVRDGRPVAVLVGVGYLNDLEAGLGQWTHADR